MAHALAVVAEASTAVLAGNRHVRPDRAVDVQPRLVTNLAEGADRLAAEAALAAAFSLAAILPFPSAEFERDFEDARSRREFRALLARCVDVCELKGERAEAARAYQAAARALLDEADVVIAVWDEGPSSGPGGTTESVAESLRRGLPVVHVPVHGGPPALLEERPERAPAGGLDRKLREALAAGLRPSP